MDGLTLLDALLAEVPEDAERVILLWENGGDLEFRYIGLTRGGCITVLRNAADGIEGEETVPSGVTLQ